MSTEIKVPALGESVSEATIAKWFKKPGDAVKLDEPLVELETDKVTIEVPSPAAGVLETVAAQTGETVKVGGILGAIGNGAAASQAPAPAPKPAAAGPAPTPKPAASASPAAPAAEAAPLSPAVRKIVEEKKLDPQRMAGSGKDGRITKGDALQAAPKAARPAQPPAPITAPPPPAEEGREVRVKMTRLRQTIARRLKEAQNTAAMLSTFNEVDMHQVIGLRTQYKETFEKRHGVKLGFMGFFVKAVIQALKEIPSINSEIDGEDIVYRNYYHIGVAVGLDKGLVVPVVRDADRLSLAEIEKEIATLGNKARDGSLKIEDMQGGTFTISNGGVYGSLMSTPILNAPQSGILGMHKIQDRPVAVNGEVAIRPMMYLALTYDHRLVDGREAVTFLVRVKESLEDPQRLILEL
ncbi:MAG TPA: 2-oxoglutarate dehydrogenase complex dihydrolipoyllysine-residue succinyltransferase [Aestuariivirgaceae bacterium]|nr:2-oxoglutarate dehydrogenase complex dihydrolipoyllysine-residue succinyltransferase [Aestuariivirgaceae bacterium]